MTHENMKGRGTTMSEKTKYTYAELLARLQQLTPEQLALPVRWCGEERGGRIDGLGVLREHQCNPSGDGWESFSDVVKFQVEEEGETIEAATAFAESEIVARAGTPVLFADGVGGSDLWDVCTHAREDVTKACGTCGSPGVDLAIEARP